MQPDSEMDVLEGVVLYGLETSGRADLYAGTYACCQRPSQYIHARASAHAYVQTLKSQGFGGLGMRMLSKLMRPFLIHTDS